METAVVVALVSVYAAVVVVIVAAVGAHQYPLVVAVIQPLAATVLHYSHFVIFVDHYDFSSDFVVFVDVLVVFLR